jgi:hypothetical protein
MAGAAAVFAAGPPRFMWTNTGLIVDHHPAQGAAAVAASALLALAAAGSRPRAVAVIGGAVAVMLTLAGAERLVWRLEAADKGLRERSLLGWSEIPWGDVDSVEPSPRALVLRERGGRAISISTSAYPPEQLTRLERTVARRVREASSR